MSEPSKYRQLMKAFALMTTITSYLVGAILIGVFGGRWLDNQLDGGGLYIVIGLLVGITTAVYGIYQAVHQFMGDDSS
ncbi:AtpZ/AtpI family protein [Salipaludibacillus sp. CUR1]|jgi:ATP synthase protein I|uniref:Putative F0F1-ATPase subunit Ca2+/Mg2+ transporter n=1 Tax=Salipaludibacillus aurantiacus TaxID=1601833 RepID=A0A1H9VD26_9BACI|nr:MULTISPECIES: AtpZ/AtpI family protein [Salipaludibacillus]MCE7792468.1 AtpZ/AtpI family protein [Salipaludibacillus sp. CUR1]SES19488.1 Putative F0F1-ATPase subunit Ca2+/Mg2+ transporter [Salipaludibacillus aurantiacus]